MVETKERIGFLKSQIEGLQKQVIDQSRALAPKQPASTLLSKDEFIIQKTLKESIYKKNRYAEGLIKKIQEAEQEVQLKEKQKQDLKEEADRLRSDNAVNEKDIRRELSEIEEKLVILRSKKEKEQQALYVEFQRVEGLIKQQKAILKKLQSEKAQQEKQVESAHLQVESRHSKEVESIKQALRPLEQAANTVALQKNQVAQILKQQEETTETWKQRLEQFQSQLQSKQEEKQNFMNDRDDLENQYQNFKQTNPLELDQFISEIDTKEKLENIKKLKQKQVDKIKQLETQIQDTREKLIEMEQGKAQKKATAANPQEIIDLENYIYQKVGNLVDEVKESLVGSEILTLQIQEIEQTEVKIMQQWAEKEQALIKEGAMNILQQERDRYKHRLAAISQWKNQVSKWLGNDNEKTDIQLIINLTTNTDDQALKSVLNLYQKKVEEYELQMQEYVQKQKQEDTVIQDNEKAINEVKTEIFNLEADKTTLRRELMSTVVEEKEMDASLKDKRIQFWDTYRSNNDTQYQQYLKDNVATFQEIGKKYGKHVVEKIKNQHREELDNLTEAQVTSRRRQLEQMYIQIQEIEKKLQDSTLFIDKELLPELSKMQEKYNAEQIKCNKLTKQIQALEEAEEEINSQMESLLETRQSELYITLNEVYKEHSNDAVEQRIMELNVHIKDREKKLESLQQQLQQIESEGIQKIQQTELEMTSVQTKYEQNQKTAKELTQAKAKVLKLENMTKQVDREIKDIKMQQIAWEAKLKQAQDAQAIASETIGFRDEIASRRKKGSVVLDENKELIGLELQESPIKENENRFSQEENPTEENIFKQYSGRKAEVLENAQNEENDQEQEIQQQEEEQVQEQEEVKEEEEEEEEKVQTIETFETSAQDIQNQSLQASQLSGSEEQFYASLQPLFDGSHLYKKHAKSHSIKGKDFDLLLAFQTPPDQCGYAIREFKLNKQLTKFEIRMVGKQTINQVIDVNLIINCIVPSQTLDVIKIQRQAANEKFGMADIPTPSKDEIARYNELKKNGLLSKQSDFFKIFALRCKMYPFSIALDKGGREELIAPNYVTFKKWTDALNSLIKGMKMIPDIRKKLK